MREVNWVMAERSRLLASCHALGWHIMLLGFASVSDRVLAQVVPDTTLPLEERSQVSTGPLFQINGGAVRDRNLFHSFGQFSLTQGETAFFNNAANVTNIISRVTGGQPSKIDGLVQANGVANLFFINPSGVLFGQNASLNVGGTFLVTTAGAIQFGNQGSYSATNPAPPPLLTVNPSALLFNQLANQPIVSQARLQVPTGQSLALVGGNILLNRGVLLAQDGRVELGGLAGKGIVELDGNGSNLRLSFRAIERSLADITLVNQSEVNVRTGGSIGIHAQNFSMADRSILRGGIAEGQGILGIKAGDITIDALGAVVLSSGSFIANSTAPRGSGDSGDVTITASSVLVKDGSQINASTFGNGDGGTVTIRSQGAVIFDGDDRLSEDLIVRSGTFSRVNAEAIGNSGGINIFAESVAVTNGALLTASTLGQGNAGSINITTPGVVRFAGVSADDQFPSGAFSNVQGKAVGSSNGINITAGSLLLEQGAQLDASTFSRGNAGKIAIQVLDGIQLKGDSSGKLADPGGLYSFIGERAIGNSGGISLAARSLSVQNGAALVASTFGQGNAGDTSVQIAGPVSLDGQTTVLYNDGQTDIFSSGIFSSVSRIARGDSGQINLTADSLTVTNGAAIASSTLGQGKAASILIHAVGAVSLDGVGIDGFPSGIFSRVGAAALGSSDINVTAQSLSLTNGAQFQANTLGAATAGSIRINTTDDIRIAGKNAATGLASGLVSKTSTSGDGGDISVEARSLYLQNGAEISAQSLGQGKAGSIAIRLRNRLQVKDSQISTTAAQSAGGNIAIAARFIVLRGDSDLTTSVLSGTGGGGNITLSARAIAALDDSDILAFSRDGSGGMITLRTPAFFGFRYQPNAASSNTETLDGNGQVDVNASGRLRSGTITLPEVTIQTSRTPLPTEVVDTSRLIAHSCIARSPRQGSFIVTGAGGLPNQPDDLATTPFPTYAVTLEETVKSGAGNQEGTQENSLKNMSPQAVITEMDGIYRLESGALILGRACHGL
ncbi:MAG: filamentous hemagglutinin N-terminal domain-containing protein [Verrucomicrobia bacterium]|nr:filamentous hemagglutinin N-terminal domain-containing protein [Leptolyngbya sp. ES-bin-22]